MDREKDSVRKRRELRRGELGIEGFSNKEARRKKKGKLLGGLKVEEGKGSSNGKRVEKII